MSYPILEAIATTAPMREPATPPPRIEAYRLTMRQVKKPNKLGSYGLDTEGKHVLVLDGNTTPRAFVKTTNSFVGRLTEISVAHAFAI